MTTMSAAPNIIDTISRPRTSPYQGLQPFTEADSRYFFGRKRDQSIIISNLYAASLTILYGASGVGKSSILLAGVVPQLKKIPELEVAEDGSGESSASTEGVPRLEKRPPLVVVVFRNWQAESFSSDLKREVLLSAFKQTGRSIEADTAAPLDQFFAQVQTALGAQLFLIFDQFEEYFLYHPTPAPGDDFEAEFARAVNRRDVKVSFLISLREEGVSKLDRFQGRIPTLLNNMLRLEHLDRASAEEAIRKPLEEYNRRTNELRRSSETANSSGEAGASDTEATIEDELVAALLEDLAASGVGDRNEQAGQGRVGLPRSAKTTDARIATPFLQMVLTRLWEEETHVGSRLLRLQTYRALGGTHKIASTHLDTALGKLNSSELQTAARLLQYLVTPSGTKIAQQPAALAEWTGLAEAEVQSILERLSASDMRILRVIAAPDQPVQFEVFHDLLARAILDWRARYTQEQKQKELARATLRARRLKRNSYVLAGVVALMVVLLVVAIRYGIVRARNAARSGELAAYAKSQLATNPDLSLLLALEAVKTHHTTKAERVLQSALAASHLRTLMPSEASNVIRSVAYSPDGKYVVTAGWNDAEKSQSEARVRDAESGQTVSILKETKLPLLVAVFSPDGRYVLTAGQDGRARVWADWQTGRARVERTIEEQQEIWTASFSPDGRYILTGGDAGFVRVWEWQAETGLSAPVREIIFASANEAPTPTPSPTPDALAPLSPTPAPSPPTRNTTTNTTSNSPAMSPSVPHNAAPSPSPTLSTGLSPSPAPSPSPRPLASRYPVVYSAAFSPDADGRYIVIAGRTSTVRVWEWREPRGEKNPLKLGGKHRKTVYSAAFSRDGRYIVTGSDDTTALVWDWQTEEGRSAPVVLQASLAPVRSVAMSDDGRLLATASQDGMTRLWDWRSEAAKPFHERKPLMELRGHTNAVFSVAFSPDNRFLLTGSEDTSARIWTIQNPDTSSLSLDALVAEAEARLARTYTAEQRQLAVSKFLNE
jgi:WD40 repeat protein